MNEVKDLEALSGLHREYEMFELKQSVLASTAASVTWSPTLHLPSEVDYSPHIGFVRQQGGAGCFFYSVAACWDIMNSLAHPYAPNVSTNRMQWAWDYSLAYRLDEPTGKFVKCRPFFPGGDCATWEEYVTLFGCPSESTELSDGEAVKWPTPVGDKEAPYFRFETPASVPVKVDVNELKMQLSQHPIVIVINAGTHKVACVGYDDSKHRFKYLNSSGDNFGDSGYDYIKYDDVKTHIQSAMYHIFRPYDPAPGTLQAASAHVKFTHSFRQDVFLWLGIEGEKGAKRIWPSGQRKDYSRNLSLNVTLPTNTPAIDPSLWPYPGATPHPFLLVYDCAEHTENSGDGGKLVDFSIIVGGEVYHCKELENGPKQFYPRQLLKVIF